jgi:S-adenosylmethionine:tRNA ribosyltransferase-isomerase
MDPGNISISNYTYILPEERIAKYPLPDRDSSNLLIYRNGMIHQDLYKNVASYLPENSLIIFNDTKVIEARLNFQKASGGIIEIFCLEPADQYPDVTTAMSQQGKVFWKCLIGGASKWKHGMILKKNIRHSHGELLLTASIHARETDTFVIELKWEPGTFSFAEVLHLAGAIPLPPYIKREVEAADAERYQTIYARESGSVAAPTAGLHFSESIFKELTKRKIQIDYVTLHVGAGTFKPVKSETMEEHEMHAEFFEADNDLVHSLLINQKITAVGTTTARSIETLYWLGVKVIHNSTISPEDLHLDQWEAYALPQNVLKEDSLKALFKWIHTNKLEKLVTKTKLLIAPGYQLRVTNLLITNFHQPQSTLLLLVAAVAGSGWRKIYDYALQNNFRFLSYGDGCLIYVE